MKKVVLGFCVVLSVFFSVSAMAQLNVWRPQNPPTIAGNLKAVQMISPFTAYVVGDLTSFITVSDSGRKWAVHPGIAPDKYKRNITLTALSFIDSDTGITVGSGLALKTTNAGTSWSALTIPGSSKYTGVLMMSKTIAIVVGDNNLIVRTTDGGKTWKQVPLESIGLLTSIRKVREDFIVITGDNGLLLFSSDSGKSWSNPPIWTNYGNKVNSVAFEDENNAICVGELGFLAATSDQGKSWHRRAWDTMGFIVSNHLNSVDTRSPGQYVAVGNRGTLVYSSDGGQRWKQGMLDFWLTSSLNFNSVWMWDKNYGFAAGDLGFLVRTTDGGATWDFIPQDPLFSRMYGIAFPKGDSAHGLAVGAAGIVMTTTNGGNQWKIVTNNTFNLKTDLFGLSFADSVTAFACGDNGKIFKTTNFGVSWTQDSTPTKRDLHSICFVDHDYGWAYGDFNTLLQTKTGGKEWYYVFNGNHPSTTLGDTITSVSFCDRKNGFVGGNLTTDGGFSWKFIGGSPQFKCHIISPTHYIFTVYVDGGGTMMGVIYTYIGDSVFAFGDQQTTPLVKFTAIDFADSLHGTVVATGGTIYQTSDAGKTWELQETHTALDLWSVCMPLNYVTSTSGNRGSIFRRTSDKPLVSVPTQSASSNSSFEIVSAYPNPASEATTLLLRLWQTMPLELRIFTELGAEVKSIDLGMQSDGEFEVPLSLSGLSSGSYILELRSADQAKHIQIKIVK